MNNSGDISACTKLAQDYFDALYNGDTALFARIFHPDATLWCAADGTYTTLALTDYLAIVAGREAPAARGDRREEAILALSIPTPTTAHLRVRELFLPKRFTDDLTLLKQDGVWRIVGKVWDFEMVSRQMTMDTPHPTSTEVLDAFIERSWRSNAERQRAKGAEFVIGRREGVHMWNLEGTHRVIDCGTGGGVHSLGHRHPSVLAALREALDEGRDTGLWTVPNQPYLALQDKLAALAPHPILTRSVVTLASTVSVDVATMFAFRLTGRQRMLAFRHGYHGHSGFAAIVTGSPDEGVTDHYNLPTTLCTFFEHYGDLAELSQKMTHDVAAIILEPMDYESFRFGNAVFFAGLRKLCDQRGVLMIIDETRTGIGRTGRLWASSHFDVAPDMMVVGKGLSGGLYPVSALLMREADYDRCMNEHRFAYISSLGGNEIACSVASAVLDVASDPALLAQGRRVAEHLENRLAAVAAGSNRLGAVYHLGFALGIEVPDRAFAKTLYAEMFRQGVLCHSICETDPAALKFFPPITMTEAEADDVADRLDAALRVLV